MHAIFFDRDGIINRRMIDDYVKRWDEFDFEQDIFDVLPEVHTAGFLAVIVTNQRGIGRGLMSAGALDLIHERMQRELEERTGHRFDAIYHCPHDHDALCDCRKPLPGMLTRAAAEHEIDLAGSWMIGDSESDIEAGIAAGCRTAKVDPEDGTTRAELRARTLGEIWRTIGERVKGQG